MFKCIFLRFLRNRYTLYINRFGTTTIWHLHRRFPDGHPLPPIMDAQDALAKPARPFSHCVDKDKVPRDIPSDLLTCHDGSAARPNIIFYRAVFWQQAGSPATRQYSSNKDVGSNPGHGGNSQYSCKRQGMKCKLLQNVTNPLDIFQGLSTWSTCENFYRGDNMRPFSFSLYNSGS